MKNKTSFLIITRNKCNYLRKTLKELKKQVKKGDEIIIIDDESSDGTKEMLEKRFSEVVYKRIKHKGYTLARMRNIGIKMAKNDRLVLMDDDLLIPEKYIENMRKFYDGKTLVTGKFKRQLQAGGLQEDWRITNKIVNKIELEKDVYELVKNKETGILHGVCGVVMFSKKQAKKIGLYDTEFDGRWGAEDSWFGIKWEHYGGRIVYMAKNHAVHQYHGTDKKKKEEQKQNREIMMRKIKELNNDKIAIIIHTFLRDDSLKTCISNIKKYVKNHQYKLYISDAGYQTRLKDEYYNELQSEGHEIIVLPFDTNWTKARNKLVKRVKENFILYIDDDFMFNEETNLDALLDILKEKKDIGIVGGGVMKNGHILQYNFKINGIRGGMEYQRIGDDTIDGCVNGTNFYYADVIANFWMAKKEVFNEAGWDEDFNIGSGHSDFFINLKFNTDWKVAYTSKCSMEHKHIGTKEYEDKRKRTEWHKKFLEKWNNGNPVLSKDITVYKPIQKGETNKVDFIIKTIERPQSLERLLLSIAQYYPDANIYIADDGEVFDAPFYKIMWDRLKDLGLKNKPIAYNLPYDTGISYGRNFLVDNSDGEYVLLLDDDFIFTGETDINKMIKILEKDKKIGLVGGSLLQEGKMRNFEGNVRIDGKDIIYSENTNNWKKIKGIKYKEVDFCFNFFLARRELFNDVRWDVQFKVSEHSIKGNQPVIVKRNENVEVINIEDLVGKHTRENVVTRRAYNLDRMDWKIWTSTGWKNMKKVIVHKCEERMTRIRTLSGIIDCTEHHSLVINKKEVSPNDLKVGDRIELYPYPKLENTMDVDKKWAWFMGFFLAEGCVSFGKRGDVKISITNQNINDLEKSIIALNRFGIKSKILNTKERKDKCKFLVIDTPKKYVKIFNEFYDNSRNKKIPTATYLWNKKSRKAFFQGFLDGDGNHAKQYKISGASGFSQKNPITVQSLLFLVSDIYKDFTVMYNKNSFGEWIKCYLLKIDEDRINRRKNRNDKIDVIRSIDYYNYSGNVYDIEIDDDEHTFLGGVGNVNLHNTDWIIRLKETKWKVVYAPEVVILHEQTFNPKYKALRARKEFIKKLFDKYDCNRLIYINGLCYEYLRTDDNVITYRINQ